MYLAVKKNPPIKSMMYLIDFRFIIRLCWLRKLQAALYFWTDPTSLSGPVLAHESHPSHESQNTRILQKITSFRSWKTPWLQGDIMYPKCLHKCWFCLYRVRI